MKGDGVRYRGGKWRIRVTFASGERREITSTKTSKRGAVRERNEIQLKEDSARQRRKLGLNPDVGYTFKEIFNRYKRIASVRANWRSLESRFRVHLLPEFGKRPLGSIAPSDVEQFLAEKQKSLSPRTCEHLRMHGSLLYSFATRKARVFMGENPFLLADRVRVPQKPVRHLEARHVQRVIDQVDARWRDMFLLCVYTGLRLGELRALQAKDIDLVHRFITVARSGSSETTKTARTRLVPIPAAAMPVASRVHDTAVQEGRAWVFLDTRGEQLSKHFKAVELLRDALAHAGLGDEYRGLKFHDLRKTFGTVFYEMTGDLRAAAKIMGHGIDVANTLYVGAGHGHLKQLADRVDFQKEAQKPSPHDPYAGGETESFEGIAGAPQVTPSEEN